MFLSHLHLVNLRTAPDPKEVVREVLLEVAGVPERLALAKALVEAQDLIQEQYDARSLMHIALLT